MYGLYAKTPDLYGIGGTGNTRIASTQTLYSAVILACEFSCNSEIMVVYYQMTLFRVLTGIRPSIVILDPRLEPTRIDLVIVALSYWLEWTQ